MCFVFVSFVSDKMGGAVDRESLSTFSYELPIGKLKCELNSNIIPIGKIQTGSFITGLCFSRYNLNVSDNYHALDSKYSGNTPEVSILIVSSGTPNA